MPIRDTWGSSTRRPEKRHPQALHNLGVLYYEGLGVPRDYEEAYNLFRAAAELNYAESQFNLAIMHEKGAGCRKDWRQSEAWLERAAANGSEDAEFQPKVPRLVRRLRSLA